MADLAPPALRAAVAVAVLAAGCPGPGARVTRPAPAVAAAPAPEAAPAPVAGRAGGPDAEAITAAKDALVARHGALHRPRIERGVDQVASLWRAEDGDLTAFCAEQFAATPAERDALFARFEAQLEQVEGHVLELGRSLRWHVDVDTGPPLPVDPLFAAFDPGAHVVEDLFTSKVAFAALLNLPRTTLADRMRDGGGYSRREWAEVRLTRLFERRIPGDVEAALGAASSAADRYVAGYDLWMHHVLDERGRRGFPRGKRLICHWNLRDEIRAEYAAPDGAVRQRTILKVMERIVTQTVPHVVIGNPRVDWNPFTNAVIAAPAETVEDDAPPAPTDRAPAPAREPDVRFGHVLAQFAAARRADPWSPTAPTAIARAFDDAEIPEDRVRGIAGAILESPLVADVAREIQSRLGRPLAPQDLWYDIAGASTPEADVDAETRRRYPTALAFAADLPRILRALGFGRETVARLTEHIVVDPSRGAGHALEARRRGDRVHLRTRVGPGGMDYKGYNIAIHELGHNVEQYLSLYEIDHTLLAGVPNGAFTEALAFLFQARDLTLLGRAPPGGDAARLRALGTFWNAWEIAGAALVEIEVWHWLYEHPVATPAELREASTRIARAVWDRHYAPVLGGAGETTLLAIYSHTISRPLYLFHYLLGHVIAFQVEEHLAGRAPAAFAAEVSRMARFGAVSPDLWMQNATGAPVRVDPLLQATRRALAASPAAAP